MKSPVAASLPAQRTGRYGWHYNKPADRIRQAYETETGRSSDDKFPPGTVGYEQFAYRSKRNKAEREAAVVGLASLRREAVAA